MLTVVLQVALLNCIAGLLLGRRLTVFALLLFVPIIAVELLVVGLSGALAGFGLVVVGLAALVAAQVGYVVGSLLGPDPKAAGERIRAPRLRRDETP